MKRLILPASQSQPDSPSYPSSDGLPPSTAAMPAFRDGESIYNPLTGFLCVSEDTRTFGSESSFQERQQDAWTSE